MARKSPDYSAVQLEPLEKLEAPPSVAEPEPASKVEQLRKHPNGRTLREAAAPVMLYLDPGALKALKRYALDQNTKVHSLLLDAVEAWFKNHGLRQHVRVQTTRKKGRSDES